jgi:hypothetical protein
MTSALAAKQLAFLRELLPEGLRFAVLANPNNEMTEAVIKELRAAALPLGREIDVFNAGTNLDIDTAIQCLLLTQSGDHDGVYVKSIEAGLV